MPKILSEKIVFDNWLLVEEAEIQTDTAVISRMRLKQPDASAVLIYNASAGNFILTEQFRYAVHSKTKEPIPEVVAGRLDAGEDPLQAAVRECREEIGYTLDAAKLVHVASCFMAPGFSSELLHHYYAEVSDQDKVSEGGGLKSEHEEITILHLPKEEFLAKVRNMELSDAKTLLLGLWWLNNRI